MKYDSFILEANHVSYLDPLAVSLKIPFRLTQCRFYGMIHIYLNLTHLILVKQRKKVTVDR